MFYLLIKTGVKIVLWESEKASRIYQHLISMSSDVEAR